MKRIFTKPYRVRTLCNLCDDGVFAVPQLQREFVWNPLQARRLVDSIYRGLPVGTLLVWRARSNQNQYHLQKAHGILPSYRSKNKEIWFLIDGQQRLSVLYKAKNPSLITNADKKELDFERLCFLFDKKAESHFVFPRRPSPGIHVPVSRILKSNWRSTFRELSEGRIAAIENCRSKLLGYKIPITFVETTDLEEVREAFLRINSGGLRISKADHAFTRASRLDLRQLVEDIRKDLPRGFEDIKPRALQAAVSVITGQADIRSRAIERAVVNLEKEGIERGKPTRDFTRKWSDISACIKKAVDYLGKPLGVINFTFLPSENMVPMLAYFFHCNNGAQPTNIQRREIKKWFWATAVAHRFVGRGYDTHIADDLKFFRRLGKNRKGRFEFNDLVPIGEVKRTAYNSGASLTAAFFLLLASKHPRYLENGDELQLLPTASLANRADKHHIFPKALLRNRNRVTERLTDSLCNICYLVSAENQSIGKNRPSMYLRPFKSKKHFARVMKSHLIAYDRESGLWQSDVKKGFKRFLEKRLDQIRRAFEREAGMRLFAKEDA